MSKKRVAIDFDGVLAYYTEWKGSDDLGEANEEGIKLVQMLHEAGIDVLVYTCRNNPMLNKQNDQDTEVIERRLQYWLDKHGLSYCWIHSTAGKPWAHAYVDDRGVHFPANTGPAIEVFAKVMNLLNEMESE